MESKTVTINDVAREAGVSIATVSRVLSGGSASASAREKVETAARFLCCGAAKSLCLCIALCVLKSKRQRRIYGRFFVCVAGIV